ncbi:MAG: M48 family metalloprotease [Spirochaetales bacterium]|nr:M48 family metalloprotease [Spirochaetales bacterium]
MKKEITRQKWARYVQTILLTLIMAGLLIFSGIQLFGIQGLLFLIVLAVTSLLFFVQAGPLPLPANARKIDYNDSPQLYEIIKELSAKAHLAQKPTLMLMRGMQMNAATIMNQNGASIILSSALVHSLSDRELKGVLAHEIGHIKQHDLSLYFLIEILRRITSFIARFGWIMLLFFFPFLYMTGMRFTLGSLLLLLSLPFFSLLIQLALLRTREFSADLNAVELTGDPEALAQALQKIDYQQKKLLSYFIPLPQNNDNSIFKTHPATAERVRRLLTLKKTE